MQRCLNCGIANALDVVVACGPPEGIHHDAHEKHSDSVPKVWPSDPIETVFQPMEPPDEQSSGHPYKRTQHDIEYEGQRAARLIRYRGKVSRHIESRFGSEKQPTDKRRRARGECYW
jgi:hypothetical protein